MKNILTCAGVAAIALSVTLGSCVSKKKYTEAQAAAEKYRQESAECATKATSLQQNLSSLEQNNKFMKSRMDSSKQTSARYQKRWNEVQTYYDQQSKSAETLRGQVSSALSEAGVTEENVQAENGRVIVLLPKSLLFKSGSNVTNQGKDALVKLAGVVESNDDYNVDVATSDSYAGYAKHMDRRNNRMMKGRDSSQARKKMSDTSMASQSSGQDKGMAKATKRHKARKPAQASNQDSTVASDDQNITAKSDDPQRPARPNMDRATRMGKTGTAESWGSDINRATAIVKVLAQNGVTQVRLIAPAYTQSTEAGASESSTEKGYYVILTPKMGRMNDMMQGSKDQEKMSGGK